MNWFSGRPPACTSGTCKAGRRLIASDEALSVDFGTVAFDLVRVELDAVVVVLVAPVAAESCLRGPWQLLSPLLPSTLALAA